MARKKSIKQKQKQQVSQKVNVKVIVGDKGGKSKRRPQPRRRREEPQVETISSKTLAPVFIQPPVVSLQSNNADVPRSSVTLPTEMFVPVQAYPSEESKVKRLGGIPKEAEDLRPAAEPLKLTSKEIQTDIDFVIPVKRDNNVPEGYGMFYDAPLIDTQIRPNRMIDRVTTSNIDYIPPAYVEDKKRDISAYSSGYSSGVDMPYIEDDKELLQEISKSLKEKKETSRLTKNMILNQYAKYSGLPNANALPSAVKRRKKEVLVKELDELYKKNLRSKEEEMRSRARAPSVSTIFTETEAMFR
jgi:hypothetical protein